MGSAGERFHAFDADNARARTAHFRTHGVQVIGQIHDLRLFGRILDRRRAVASVAAIMMFSVAPTLATSR